MNKEKLLKFFEEKECVDCKHFEKEDDDYPCCACRNDYVRGSEEFYTYDYKWEPKEESEENETKNKQKVDMVNKPPHYTRDGAMETIEEMILLFGREEVMTFCKLNAWKYRARALYKNMEEDMKKSDWYLSKYKELENSFVISVSKPISNNDCIPLGNNIDCYK